MLLLDRRPRCRPPFLRLRPLANQGLPADPDKIGAVDATECGHDGKGMDADPKPGGPRYEFTLAVWVFALAVCP